MIRKIKSNRPSGSNSAKRNKSFQPQGGTLETFNYFKNKKKKKNFTQPEPIASLEAHPTDNRFKSLRLCNTKQDVDDRLAATYDKHAEKSRKAFEPRLLPGDKRNILEKASDGEIITSLPLTCHKSIMLAASSMLGEALGEIASENPDIEVAFVTAIAGDGGTSHIRPFIELNLSQQRFKRTLSAISPNFFGVTELALFNSHSHPKGGQLLQRHEHGLVWGPGCLSRAQQIAESHMSRYPANRTEAPQLVIRDVGLSDINLYRMASYFFEAPCRCMTWCPPKAGRKGHMHHSEKGDRFMRYLRLIMIRMMLSLEDVSFAGGHGKAIRSNMIKRARAIAETHSSSKRLLHPDEIASKIIELSAALKRKNWALPIIGRRK
ncbi:MAG: hypothetical protein BGO57_04125 [Sphingomonadales bacterium 63-6]|nr:MAG: hypothetical protein BGO57_04125 [Sphingomonadales bacterium 63-6]